MLKGAKKTLGFMILGVIGASLLTFGAQSVLRWQVKVGVEEDLTISAQLMLERASDATQTAIDVLNTLTQSSGLSCTNDHRFLYSEATRSTAWVDTIGLVDRSGNLVCTDLGQSSRQVGLLQAYDPENEDITLSLSSSTLADATPSLLIVRHIVNGRRLVARVPGELIKLDPVRNDLRRFRAAMLSLGAANPWYVLEPLEIGGNASVRVLETSEFMPFEVQISIPDLALDAVTQDTRRVINMLGMVMAVLGVVAGYYFGRHRPDEGDRILAALDNGEFVPYLQPIVDLDTGSITGCEVLARWNKPDGSVVPPSEFIPLTQNYRLTREVTCCIMEETRDVLAPLIAQQSSFKVSFNLFSHQLIDDTIVSDIRDVFGESEIGFDHLIFEISDRVEITDMALTKDVISQIQALGAEIALDDVGSGHSGLYNLTSIGVDILKLDKLMVDSLRDGFVGFELVRSLIELADNLDIGVIAEGIETEEQVNQLRKLGVSVAQGYLFAPPLPIDSFVHLLNASRSNSKGSQTEQITDQSIEAADAA